MRKCFDFKGGSDEKRGITPEERERLDREWNAKSSVEKGRITSERVLRLQRWSYEARGISPEESERLIREEEEKRAIELEKKRLRFHKACDRVWDCTIQLLTQAVDDEMQDSDIEIIDIEDIIGRPSASIEIIPSEPEIDPNTNTNTDSDTTMDADEE